MGTNYYLKQNIQFPLTYTINSLEELNELKGKLDTLQEKIHLGKTSSGWKFLANWNRGKYYNDYHSYQEYINNIEGTIYDEYNKPLTKLEFLEIVQTQKGKSHREVWPAKYFRISNNLEFADGDWS